MSCFMDALNRDHVLQDSGVYDLYEKISSANALIVQALETAENPRLTFSGGKDSLIVLDLVRRIMPDINAVFCNTGNEYRETPPYVRQFENITELHPEKGFWTCAKEYGLPKRKSEAKRHGNACCFWLKEKPAADYYKKEKVDLIFTGLTEGESRNRWMFFRRMGPHYFAKTEQLWKCHPIHNWTEKNVWDYIKLKNLAYNPIYDMGLPRCGCRFCTAYISWKDVTAKYNPKDTEILYKKMNEGNRTLNDFPGK